LLYGSENWTINASYARTTAVEVTYMRRTVGYYWTDRETNMDFAKELNITPVF
jgi:hypothetical protein